MEAHTQVQVNRETGIGGEERERDDAGWHVESALLDGCFSRPFYTEGRQLADDPDSWIRNGRIANLESATFRNFFGRPCSGEPRSSVFWTSLPRRVKGDADLDVARVHRARTGPGVG